MNSVTHTSEQLTLLPLDQDPFEALVKMLLFENQKQLPRLERTTVLIPDIADAPHLRQLLLLQTKSLGFDALLGPQIHDCHNWLARLPVTDMDVISDYRRELILVQALNKHSELFGAANHWALADSLLQLFDELTLNKVGLPESIEDFQQRVASAYGLSPHVHNAMEREAQLIHTLWRAWHQELNERGFLDRNTHYLMQLAASLKQPSLDRLYILAPIFTCVAEHEWLGNMAKQNNVHIILQGHITPDTISTRLLHPATPLSKQLEAMGINNLACSSDSNYSRMLDEIFAPQTEKPLQQRALEFADTVPDSPLNDHLALFAANSDEEEARAVELQVRRWLLEGKKQISIVCENRRLARRIRALLERANVPINDTAGWALSTTSAAAILERWLQCIEEDFPHLAMLDLLKSPFFCAVEQRDTHLADVYLLERDIVLHEKIGSGIARYRRHLSYRQGRLPSELAARLKPVDRLLERLQRAAELMRGFLSGNPSRAADLLATLRQSLQTLGLEQQLNADEAGTRLLEELQKMEQAASGEEQTMQWLEFRSWLGRNLERYDFKPAISASPVLLMELTKGSPNHSDALIIAAAELEQIPGAIPTTPFFNDAVRHELKLPGTDEQLAVSYYHFRRLLEAAPSILITHCTQRNDEEILASPWLELLLAFQRFAYQTEPNDLQLPQLLNQDGSAVVHSRLQLSQCEMPCPTIYPSLLPKRYSASAYQQLMDCPYQFFAARGLNLAPTDVIREALEKSDYGERVHRCLQAFHENVEGLPGPFSGSWEPDRRNEAISLLEQISSAVFARDLEDNFLHRGWLQRWNKRIPEYIDWQLQHATRWQVAAVEQQLQQERAIPGLTLHGRVDRCDSDGESLAIIDYKTGSYANLENVSNGEAIQLPFYALLSAYKELPVKQVGYLALDETRVCERTQLEGDDLDKLSHQVGDRLGQLHQQMLDGAELPAWGDDKTCGYCRFAGLCRRAVWTEK